MTSGFHPRMQGDLGEAAAIEWLTRIGICVAFPLFHSPDYDLIADLQRDCSGPRSRQHDVRAETDHYAVQLATSGGNQKWTGVVKTFDPKRVDSLFVLVAGSRRWFIPAQEVEGRSAISVGGSKYSEFQVGQATPFGHPDPGRSKLGEPRGGAGVGEPGQTVNLVPQLLSGFDSHPPHFSPPSGGDSVSRPDKKSRHRPNADVREPSGDCPAGGSRSVLDRAR
jgi:hypothetical protein